MRGGLKFYRGSGAAARNYVEADRSRADDYYLREGGGVADRWVFDAGGGAARRSVLDGDQYQVWVEGIDPATGEVKGRLRQDGNALRFCETVVNGPKSWSIAAALHPELSAALDAAQDRAVARIGRYVAGHAVTRVGPRGGQVQVGVGQVELAAVRHYTSRAGDPHRHIHLQINARMLGGDGKWRGVDSAALREQVQAINGIGHASVVCDPVFRQRLSGLGYTLDVDGEIVQLAAVVPAMSKRSAQVAGLIGGFERAWQVEHPGQVPGPGLARGWDARAWNQDRPDKDHHLGGDQWTRAWRAELAELGVDVDQVRPAVPFEAVPAGRVDQHLVAEKVVAGLSARRSAWNTADLRGAVEMELARAGVIAGEQVLTELALQITQQAAGVCRSILDEPASGAAPVQSRQWTSVYVAQVEADLTGRMAVRSAMGGQARDLPGTGEQPAGQLGGRPGDIGLDVGQRAAVAVVCGTHALAVIQGAAGAGKTTMLAAAKQIIDSAGGRLVLITPTLKAARIAQSETGADTSSAAKLAHEHGYRWDAAGVWTRLTAGESDPRTGALYQGPHTAARLTPGSVIVVDEAGMLDQDTARAVFTIADEADARVVLVGDRAQHAAVGRGGVLDLAARWTGPDAHIEMDQVHRFRRETVNEAGGRELAPDVDYAALSLAMREGTNPAAVFDELRRRGQIIVADTPEKAGEYIAAQAAATLLAGGSHSVVAATNEQTQLLNTAIRDRLVAAGRVHDTVTTTGMDGLRIGVGDTITTRANSTEHHVANRDTWTVTKVDPAGVLTVTGPVDGHARTLPPAYVHTSVQLGYATTGHGAQGATTDAASTLHTEHTDAAGQYVAMTRGRLANTAVLVAGNHEQARNQWIAAAGRDRADRGLEAARTAARIQAQQYQALTPTQTSATQQLYEKLHAQNPARRQAKDAADRQLVQQYRAALAARITTLTSTTEQHTQHLLEREQARTARIAAGQAKAAELKPLIQDMAVEVEKLRTKSGMDAPPPDQPHIIGSPSVAAHLIGQATERAQQIREQYTAEANRQLLADRDKVREAHRVAQEASRSAERASVFRRASTRRAAEQAQQHAAQVRAAATARWEGVAGPDPQRRAEGIKNLVDRQPAVVAADQAVDNATAKLTYITAAQQLHALRQQLHSLEPDPVRDRETRTAADIAALSWGPDPAIAQQARDLQLLAAARTRSAALQEMTPNQQVGAAAQWKTDEAAQTARAAQQIQDGIRRAQEQQAQRDRDDHYH
ncbi:MAG: MobF family relaxase, partial [Nakamurella sp.]